MKTKMTLVTINVTANDIKHGKRRDCRACPIARAVLRKVDHKKALRAAKPMFNTPASMGARYVHVGDHCCEDTPSLAVGFVSAFDDGYPVEPFKFQVSIPTKFLKRPSAA